MKTSIKYPWCLWALSLVFSYLVSVYLLADRAVDIISFQTMISCMNGENLTGFCIIAAGTWAFQKVLTVHSRRFAGLAAIGAGIFALFDFLGFNLSQWDSLFRPNAPTAAILLDICSFLGSFLLFWAMLQVGLNYLTVHPLRKSASSKLDLWLGSNCRSFLLCWFALFLIYLVFFLIFYPGVTTLDSTRQIAEGLQMLPLSDAHPYVHTLLMGGLIRLGWRIFGTIGRGVGFYTLIQALLIALATAVLLRFLAREKIPLGFRIAAFCYFAFHPIIACYSVTIWKDIWQSYFILLYMLNLTVLALRKEDFFKNRNHLLMMAVTLLGILFFKNTGILIVLISLPFVLAASKGFWKKILATFGLCIAAFVISHNVIIPACGIIPGQVREPLSVPLQQIGRVAAKSQLTEEDRAVFGEILPVEQLPALYDPDIADPIKSQVAEEVFSSNPSRYLKAWISLGMRHPGIYLESFLVGSRGYWYPDVNYWQILCYTYYDSPLTGEELSYQDPDAADYPEITFDKTPRWQFVRLYEILRIVPGISTLLRLACYFWSAVLVMLLCIAKKKTRLLLPLAPLFAVFIICIMSPVYAECRYAYAAILAPPLLWAFALQAD